MKISRILLGLLLGSTCHAASALDWETKDTALLSGAIGLLVADWGQTHDLVRRNTTYYLTPACSDPATRQLASAGTPGGCPPQSFNPYRETNPLLPKNPSTGTVDKYFAVAIFGTAGLAYVMPPKYRRPFLGGVIVLEAIVVLRNNQLGLRLSF